VYIAMSPNVFIVTRDPITNQHVVTIDQSEEALIDTIYPENRTVTKTSGLRPRRQQEYTAKFKSSNEESVFIESTNERARFTRAAVSDGEPPWCNETHIQETTVDAKAVPSIFYRL